MRSMGYEKNESSMILEDVIRGLKGRMEGLRCVRGREGWGPPGRRAWMGRRGV